MRGLLRVPYMTVWLACVGVVILAAAPVAAQPIVSASPDVTIDLGAVVVADENVAVDNQLGIVMLADLGMLPQASDVVALGEEPNGDRLFALDTTVSLPGGVVARAGDVVRYDGISYAIAFDAQAAGLPAGTLTDAVSPSTAGLLLSFDSTVDLGGGLVAADEDLVIWNGSTFAMALDGSAAGIDPALDVDAAQDLGGGAYLVSLDTTGMVGGVVADDEDVLHYDGANWSLAFDGSAANPSWAAADLDAVSFLPEPGLAGMLVAGSALAGALRRWRHGRRQSGVSLGSLAGR